MYSETVLNNVIHQGAMFLCKFVLFQGAEQQMALLSLVCSDPFRLQDPPFLNKMIISIA